MNLKDYTDKAESVEIGELKDKTLSDLIAKFHVKNISRMYVLKENKPVYVLSAKEIVDIFLNDLQNQNAYDYLKEKPYLKCFDSNMHIIDAYYQMRKNNSLFMPVCEGGKFIGEIDFQTLSLKITFIVIKDQLTGVYNKKYFDVIIEEYQDFNKPIGFIFIEIKDLPIFEGLYGVDMVNEIILTYARILKKSVRNIDFIFRWDNQFRIIVFNNLEVTAKVFERIKNRLENIKINDIKIPFNICMTHVPELNYDIIMAVEDCEERLIKRD